MPESSMSDEFYEWLDNCPCIWFRVGVSKDGMTYKFLNNEGEVE